MPNSDYSLSFLQRRVKELLAERDQALSKIYEGALHTFYTGKYPESIAQTAHSFRELTKAIPHHIDLPRLLREGESKKDITHRNTLKRLVAQTAEVENLPRFVEEQDQELADAWHEIHNYFVDLSHHDLYGEISRIEFENKIEKFNEILLQALPQHYERTDELKRLMDLPEPRKEDVEQALSLLTTKAAFEDFFTKAPLDWYDQLKQQEVFDEPPSIQKQEGSIRTPRWPPAIYIARIAEEQPEIFLEEVKKLPQENIRILDDLIDGFLNLPLSKSEAASKELVEWINTPYFAKSVASAKIIDLIKKWITEEQYTSVLTLLTPLTEIKQSERKKQTESSVIEDVEFENINAYQVKNLLQELNWENWGFEQKKDFLNLFIRRLKDVIDLNSPKGSKFSNSEVWRPAIEENDQNSSTENDIRHIFVKLCRNIAEKIIEGNPEKTPEVIRGFLETSYPVLQRIGIHLTRRYLGKVSTLLDEVVSEEDFFTLPVFHHEYYLLLEEHFDKLNDETRKQIFTWIKNRKGFDVDSRKEHYKRRTGEVMSDEELDRQRKRWIYRHLYPIRNYLEGEWKDQYKTLDQKFSEPDHPEFLVYSSPVWVGSKSPLTAEDFENLSIHEVKDYLSDWTPPEKSYSLDNQKPSVDGLASTLASDVGNRPYKYAEEILLFEDEELDPYYIQSIFSGFANAVEEGLSFDWKKVLQLGVWATSIDWDEEIGLENSTNKLRHIVRKSAGWLLQKGLRSDEITIPEKHEGIVWEIIGHLIDDPEPDQSYEQERGLGNRAPNGIAINTIRGTGMELLFIYCRWCYDFSEEKRKDVEFLSNGSDLPKKAGEKLEKHLNPEYEPSISIHSLYGKYFGRLYFLDATWVKEHSQLIFPEDDFERWASAWGAFIKFNKPHKDLFELLYLHYERAVGNIPEINKNNKSGLLGNYREYNRRLSSHIIASYWSGERTLEEHHLLNAFLKNAPDSTRASAVRQLGKNLEHTDLSADSAEWEKLENYWRSRLEKAEHGINDKAYDEELGTFITWLKNIPAGVDVRSILELLKEILDLDIDLGSIREHELIPYLAEISEEYPSVNSGFQVPTNSTNSG